MMKKYHPIIILLLLSTLGTGAQDTLLNKYGLWVISSATTYMKTVNRQADKRMVNLQQKIPGIVFDLKYAGTDNFMHEKLYPPVHTTYLRAAASLKLYKVQQELRSKNLGLKIWDAYRPYSVTVKMWEPIKDDRYVADPKQGSGHNRGIAVDLTLIDLITKKELDMGTGFDNFSDSAHSDYKNLPAAILTNRELLRSTMEKYGFRVLDSEWWHFYLPDPASYELLDLSFDELQKLTGTRKR